MKLIRKESRPILKIDEYMGTCHNCQGAVELLEPLLIIPLFKDKDSIIVVPGDWLECPHCHTTLSIIHITGDHLFQTKLIPPKHQGLN